MYRIVITKEEDFIGETEEWQELYDTHEEAKAAGKESRYGYVTKKARHTKSTQVLEQCVDELDLTAVIKAVNKIGD